MKFIIIFLVAGMLFFGCIGGYAPKSGESPEEGIEEKPSDDLQNESDETKLNETPTEDKSPNTINVSVDAGNRTSEVKNQTSKRWPDHKTKEISFKTKDAWEIHGTLHYAELKTPETAVILLPGVNETREDFGPLIHPLRKALPGADVLAIDMRGHGKSTNKETRENFISGDYISMKNDVAGAITYLKTKRPGIDRFYIIGSSVGGSAGMKYAVDDSSVAKLIMISPGIKYQGVDIEKAAWDYIHGLYVTAANGDDYSRMSANKLYSESPADEKEIKIFDGVDGAHGTELFAATANSLNPLTSLIADWVVD
jgi:pimeloyl-ACP methyl ester carboxylesterase